MAKHPLSAAEIEQRRNAARSRWRRAGVSAGIGAAAGVAAALATRRMLSARASQRIGEKGAEILERQLGAVDRWAARMRARIAGGAADPGRGAPSNIVANSIKRLNLVASPHRRVREALEREFEGGPAVPSTVPIREAASGVVVPMPAVASARRAGEIEAEIRDLKSAKLRYRTNVRQHSRKISTGAAAIPRHRATVTQGKLPPYVLKALRATLRGHATTRRAALENKLVGETARRRAAAIERAVTISARIAPVVRARIIRPKPIAAAGLGAALATGGTAYGLSELGKAAGADNPSFAARIAAALAALKDHAAAMVSHYLSGLSPFDWAGYEQGLDRAVAPLVADFTAGAAEAERAVPATIAFSFETKTPEVLAHFANYRANLIRYLTTQQRDAVRAVLLEGTSNGDPPATMARKIREIVGLTPYQAANVRRYRGELEALDPRALGRELRDHRFDGSVAAAIKTNTALPEAKVDRMVDAYSRRYLALRANTIARTESLGAADLGQYASVVETAKKHDMTVRKVWHATHDNRTREAHRELDGQSVLGLETPFQSILGPIRYPHDPEAVASNRIGCRCYCQYELTPNQAVHTLLAAE